MKFFCFFLFTKRRLFWMLFLDAIPARVVQCQVALTPYSIPRSGETFRTDIELMEILVFYKKRNILGFSCRRWTVPR